MMMSSQADAVVAKAKTHLGFKEGTNHNLLDDWFGAGDARFDSILLFSFFMALPKMLI